MLSQALALILFTMSGLLQVLMDMPGYSDIQHSGQKLGREEILEVAYRSLDQKSKFKYRSNRWNKLLNMNLIDLT